MAGENDLYKNKRDRLFMDSSLVGSRLFELDLFLDTVETRDDFPYDLRKKIDQYKSKMMEITNDLSGMENPMDVYTREGKVIAYKIGEISGGVRYLIDELRKYRQFRSGELDNSIAGWSDPLNYEIDKLESSITYVEDMAKTAYEVDQMPTVKKKKPMKTEQKAIVTVILLTFLFASLSALSSAPSTTGYYIGLSGGLAEINYEALYVIASSTIVFIYALGRTMEKW